MKKKDQVTYLLLISNELLEIDISLRESDLTKQLKQKSIELCEMPRLVNGLSSTMNARKKAMEI